MGDWQHYAAQNPLMLPPRRRVFVSFAQFDRAEVDIFVYRFSVADQVISPCAVGLAFGDDMINSTDPEYVMNRIRQDYLADTTVTIVLIGQCTHSRRFVDWELKASLRRGEVYTPNGLLGILLPSAGAAAHLPERFQVNWQRGEQNCYARYRAYPNSGAELRAWIEDAYSARTTRAHWISNAAEMMRYNRECRIHGVTHPA